MPCSLPFYIWMTFSIYGHLQSTVLYVATSVLRMLCMGTCNQRYYMWQQVCYVCYVWAPAINDIICRNKCAMYAMYGHLQSTILYVETSVLCMGTCIPSSKHFLCYCFRKKCTFSGAGLLTPCPPPVQCRVISPRIIYINLFMVMGVCLHMKCLHIYVSISLQFD